MLPKLFKKILRDPIGLMKLAFEKLVLGPIKYRRGEGYDAERYWGDRLGRHGENMKGPGEEGMSEEENRQRYERLTGIFHEFCQRNLPPLGSVDVLEIGTGTGLITTALKQLGAVSYRGVDVTDVVFPMLRSKFPGFAFEKCDITEVALKESYDVIVMIDVCEHIVETSRFAFAMKNMRDSLKAGGIIIIAPIVEKNEKHLFYERHWCWDDVKMHFEGFDFPELTTWEQGFSRVAAIRKPHPILRSK